MVESSTPIQLNLTSRRDASAHLPSTTRGDSLGYTPASLHAAQSIAAHACLAKMPVHERCRFLGDLKANTSGDEFPGWAS